MKIFSRVNSDNLPYARVGVTRPYKKAELGFVTMMSDDQMIYKCS